MTHEARRGLRTAISITHMVAQLIMIFLVFEQGTVLKMIDGKEIPHAEIRLLQYICITLALFAINYSASKMLSHSHSSYDKG